MTGAVLRQVDREATARATVDRMAALITPGSTLLLIDEGFLDVSGLADRRIVRFRQAWTPASEEQLLKQLNAFNRDGIDYVVFAWPALWWIQRFPGLTERVQTLGVLALAADGVLAFRCRPNALAQQRDDWRRRCERSEWLLRMRDVTTSLIAPGAVVLVATGGDDGLLQFGRGSRHFPSAAGGEYAGSPAGAADLIENLEAQRHRGARHLLLPSWLNWWLEHYGAFADHLEDRYRLVWADPDGLLYDLGCDPS